MKSSKFFILFIFVSHFVFSQQKAPISVAPESSKIAKDSAISNFKSNEWSIEVGTGITNGTRPYNDGYYTSSNNKLLNGFVLNCYSLGVNYNFSKFIAVKMDVAFNHFINNKENTSKPFEAAQYRTSFQGVLNVTRLVNLQKEESRVNLLFHGGLNFARIIPVAADYNKKVSNGEFLAGLVIGLTPTIKIHKKTSVFLDFSSFNNYGQNLTWNGKHSDVSDNSVGHMYSVTFGLSIALDKKK